MALKFGYKKGKKDQQVVLPPRREEPPKAPHVHDESNWLVSYADMMTLLCGFFIMLFSLAKMDEPQYEAVKEAVARQFGGPYISPTKPTADFVSKVMETLGKPNIATIQSDVFGVTIVFKSTVFFDTLDAEVNPAGKVLLTDLIKQLRAEQVKQKKDYRIVVEGHTDSRPIIGGIYPSNWELSGARAARVVRMFLDQGFAADRLTAIGYADTRPKVLSRTPAGAWDEEALAENRRVVLRILEPKVDSIPLPEAAKPLTKQELDGGSREPAAAPTGVAPPPPPTTNTTH